MKAKKNILPLLLLALCLAQTSFAQVDVRHDILKVPFEDISTAEAIELLRGFQEVTDSSLIDYGERLAIFAWHRAMHEDSTDLAALARKIFNFAYEQNRYQFLLEAFHDVIDTATTFKISERLLANKYLAVALNKQGQFKASVEVLNNGLELARKVKDEEQIRDYYHHLTYEYRYLSLIDKNLTVEYYRLNQKCLEYNLKLGYIYESYPHIIQKMVPIWDLSACRRNLDSLLYLFKDHHDYYGMRYAIMEEYFFAVFLKGYYRECISIIEKFDDEFPGAIFALTGSLAASSYMSLGLKDSARYFAEFALREYLSDQNQDEKRFVLCFLPQVLYDLGNFEYANLLENDRYHFLRQQFIHEPIQFIEQERFHDELSEARESHDQDRATNQFLIFLIISSCMVVPIFVYSDLQIRKRNHIISQNAKKLKTSNSVLSSANSDLESYAFASAHDIRNPLRSISQILDIVQQDEDNQVSAQSQHYISSIEGEVVKVDKYIRGILEYAQINKKIMDIETEVDAERILRNLESKLNKEFQIAHPMIFRTGSLPLVTADPLFLETLLYNLLTNAIKFQRKEETAAIHIIASKKKNKLKIEIVDHGIGIPPDELKYVSNLFYRASNADEFSGAGVGLASSQKIAKLNDMKLKLENNTSAGITATLQIPLA